MSINTLYVQGKLRLSGVVNSVPMAGLKHLSIGLLPISREHKITVASSPLPQSQQCPECKTDLGAAHDMYCRFAVCDHCGYHFVRSASDRIEHLADTGSFRTIGHPIQPVDFLGFVDEFPYSTKLISGQNKLASVMLFSSVAVV